MLTHLKIGYSKINHRVTVPFSSEQLFPESQQIKKIPTFELATAFEMLVTYDCSPCISAIDMNVNSEGISNETREPMQGASTLL